jgi:hypothetical protein
MSKDKSIVEKFTKTVKRLADSAAEALKAEKPAVPREGAADYMPLVGEGLAAYPLAAPPVAAPALRTPKRRAKNTRRGRASTAAVSANSSKAKKSANRSRVRSSKLASTTGKAKRKATRGRARTTKTRATRRGGAGQKAKGGRGSRR